MISMGFVHNYHQLLTVRIFLGVTEAGLFPGVSFFLTQWYRRYEVNFRISMFFSAATLAGAFGGLLARLINEMDGDSGYEGWRWYVQVIDTGTPRMLGVGLAYWDPFLAGTGSSFWRV